MPTTIDLGQIEADIYALEHDFGVEVYDSLIDPSDGEYPYIHVVPAVFSTIVTRIGPNEFKVVCVNPKHFALLIERMKEILNKLPI